MFSCYSWEEKLFSEEWRGSGSGGTEAVWEEGLGGVKREETTFGI